MGRNKNIDKIGEIYINNSNETVKIIDYKNAQNCSIQYSDGTIEHNKRYSHILIGSVKNPNKYLYYGVGYIGIGKYNSNNCILIWTMWEKMLMRCYDKNYQILKPTYIGCSVHENWHNFQNFVEWYNNNYINGFQLDKDILIKNNKIYGPNTCCFVPQEINQIIFSNFFNENTNLPKGISFAKDRNKYRVKIGVDNKQIHLGQYNDVKTAFFVYCDFKENLIKELTEKYKNLLNKDVYNILINYKIELK